MAFRYRSHARRRALGAAILGVIMVLVFGPLLVIPAIALVALVYYAHQLAAVMAGDNEVPYPNLALVIVINSLVVLVVQMLLAAKGFKVL